MRTRSRMRRGGMLLEVLLALGLFVATGGLVLSVLGDCTRAIARAEQLAAAVDAARSVLAEFEAGLRPMGDLAAGDLGELAPPWQDLRVEVRGRRSDQPALVLAEAKVFARAAPDDSAPLFVLRQLMSARRDDLEALEAELDATEATGDRAELERESPDSDLFPQSDEDEGPREDDEERRR